MGRISENEIWVPEPESKVSQTFSLSPGQVCTPPSGCGPCFVEVLVTSHADDTHFFDSSEEYCYPCLRGGWPRPRDKDLGA